RMSVSWPSLVATILGTFLGQVAIAWLAVRLALGRFRQEKWWEKKYEAYIEILVALHQVKKDFFDSIEWELQSKERPEEKEKEFKAAYSAAKNDIMRHSDLGDFLISANAVRILKDFGKGVAEASASPYTYYDYLEGNAVAVRKALEEMLAEAKLDLMGG